MIDDQPVLVLTTGGTIDKTYFDALDEYRIGESAVPRLLALGRVRHAWRTVEVLRKDSLELTDADRAAIRAVLEAAPERRVVITHGTDTMTQTARAVAGLKGRAIVLTGALAPARFQESDAAFNLGMAFAVAQVAPPGVYITMNGTVFDGLAVIKDRSAGAFVATPAD